MPDGQESMEQSWEMELMDNISRSGEEIQSPVVQVEEFQEEIESVELLEENHFPSTGMVEFTDDSAESIESTRSITPTPAPRRSNRLKSNAHLHPYSMYNFKATVTLIALQLQCTS